VNNAPFFILITGETMSIVFWVIVVIGTISAVEGNSKLNKLCQKEIDEGVSATIKECKQYQFDTRIKTGW
jgi:hypothetical protein